MKRLLLCLLLAVAWTAAQGTATAKGTALERFTTDDQTITVTYDGNKLQVPKQCELELSCHPQEERMAAIENAAVTQAANLRAVKTKEETLEAEMLEFGRRINDVHVVKAHKRIRCCTARSAKRPARPAMTVPRARLARQA